MLRKFKENSKEMNNESKTEHIKYVELLDAILKNARNLELAGACLLKSEQSRSFAKFLLYSCIEECGKFLLVKDRYPQKLSKSMLHKIGFYDHKPKLSRVIRNFEIEYGEMNPAKNVEKMITDIRSTWREGALYVDYSNKPIMPRSVLSREELDNLVKVVVNCFNFCDIKLKEFKNNPILRN